MHLAPYVSDGVLFSESTLEVGGCSTSLAQEDARLVHPSYRFGTPVVRDNGTIYPDLSFLSPLRLLPSCHAIHLLVHRFMTCTIHFSDCSDCIHV